MSVQVGFGKDFQASRNIDNDVGKNFRLLGSFLSEGVKRSGSPLRQFSRSPVCSALWLPKNGAWFSCTPEPRSAVRITCSHFVCWIMDFMDYGLQLFPGLF